LKRARERACARAARSANGDSQLADKPATAYREIAEYYDGTYYRDRAGCSHATTGYADLCARLGLSPGRRLLDVACGTGGWLRVAQAAGVDAYGIDISSVAVGRLAGSGAGIHACLAIGEKLPFPSGYFDAVTCLGSLEHFLDQEAALREMVRVARPGADILIIVPNSGFLTYRLGWYRGTEQARVRETLRSIPEWEQMFGRAGLRIVRRWPDWHIVNREWILRRGLVHALPRAVQALLLLCWPLRWQYQVCFLARTATGAGRNRPGPLLLVARSYPPRIGGLERYAHDLHASMREIMDVELLENHRARWLLPMFALRVLWFILFRRRFAHIHFCDGALAPVGLAARIVTGARVSITIHALDIIYARFMYQALVPPCVRRLDRVVCVSRFTRDECVRRGVDAGRCEVIPNGVPLPSAAVAGSAESGTVERRIGVALEGRTVLISICRLIPRKGIAWFVREVMPQLPERYVYVVAGEGPERAAIEREIIRQRLGERVVMIGNVGEAEKQRLFALAHLYVMPNLAVAGDAEGFGISIIEAGANGIAAVAARVDGIPDAIVEDRSGSLVPPGDAAAFAAAIVGADFSADEVRRAVMERFDWKVLRGRYLELFGGTGSDGGRGGGGLTV
jgi:glycosyltransferase involved in cell wall biosynthesis/SAM-dependent methyltransferase